MTVVLEKMRIVVFAINLAHSPRRSLWSATFLSPFNFVTYLEYVFRIFSSLYLLLCTHSVSVNTTAFQFASLFSDISICALWVAALDRLVYQ